MSPTVDDAFVRERRSPRPLHDPLRPQGTLVEDEPGPDGRVARALTIFLTGRECPWRCVMCDLWKYTTEADTPPGALLQQIDEALASLTPPLPPTIKLYNAGSFFDPRAVPESDYGPIADRLRGFARVVVESHPALVGPRLDFLLSLLRGPALEVAMGLETAHPDALARLNKRMTVEQFQIAARGLRARNVALRVFLLAPPPFIPSGEQDEWMERSVETAIDCGASAISLIPTRTGNGALDALAEDGRFTTPRLADLERWHRAALAVATGRARVFLDLWEIQRFAGDASIADALGRMNLEQRA